MKLTFNNAWPVFEEVITEFVEVNVLKMSTSLTFYTLFALASMFIIIIIITPFFFGAEAIEGELYPQFAELIGSQAATQVEQIIKNAAISERSALSTTSCVAMLMFIATGVFVEIQESIISAEKSI